MIRSKKRLKRRISNTSSEHTIPTQRRKVTEINESRVKITEQIMYQKVSDLVYQAIRNGRWPNKIPKRMKEGCEKLSDWIIHSIQGKQSLLASVLGLNGVGKRLLVEIVLDTVDQMYPLEVHECDGKKMLAKGKFLKWWISWLGQKELDSKPRWKKGGVKTYNDVETRMKRFLTKKNLVIVLKNVDWLSKYCHGELYHLLELHQHLNFVIIVLSCGKIGTEILHSETLKAQMFSKISSRLETRHVVQIFISNEQDIVDMVHEMMMIPDAHLYQSEVISAYNHCIENSTLPSIFHPLLFVNGNMETLKSIMKTVIANYSPSHPMITALDWNDAINKFLFHPYNKLDMLFQLNPVELGLFLTCRQLELLIYSNSTKIAKNYTVKQIVTKYIEYVSKSRNQTIKKRHFGKNLFSHYTTDPLVCVFSLQRLIDCGLLQTKNYSVMKENSEIRFVCMHPDEVSTFVAENQEKFSTEMVKWGTTAEY